MNNKYLIILFIVIGVFVSSLISIYALSVIQPGKTIEAIAIPIAFLNIFATGYGAYLGAKISGENATELMKNQLILTEFEKNSNNDIEFLEKFNHIVHNFNLNSILEEKNLDLEIDKYISARKEFNKLETKGVSRLIRYPFEVFNESFDREIKKMEEFTKLLNNRIEEFTDEKLNVKLSDYALFIDGINCKKVKEALNKNEDIIQYFYTIYEIDNDQIHPFRSEFCQYPTLELYNYIKMNTEEEQKNIIKTSINIIENLNEMQFKSPKDINEFVLEYYK